MRRRTVVAAVAAALLLATAGAGVALTRGEPASGDDPPPARSTVEVTRGDLRQVETLAGALGFGAPVTVAGRSGGTITWLPSAGVRVGRGDQLYRVDDAPVTLLVGDLPLYRTLAVPHAEETGRSKGEPDPPPPPLTGRDVDLVATNLAALGFWNGPTEDASYDAWLAGAVEDWQESVGAEPTGVLEPSDVVVTDGPVRVDDVVAAVGGEDAGDVLTFTGTERVLELRVAAAQARQLEPRDRVRVVLADGHAVRTRVTSIGGRAVESDDGGPPAVQVLVRARRPAALEEAPLGPVTATLTTASRRDVLQVPLTALLALADGGYALEEPDGTLLPVTLGMVADGVVEVEGVEEGTTVVAAS